MHFSKELSVGNWILDSEHKNLHEIINGIRSAIESGGVVDLLSAFNILKKRLCDYFAIEENIAQALNFDFTQHKLAHQNLLGKFQHVIDEMMATPSKLPGDYIDRIQFLERELV